MNINIKKIAILIAVITTALNPVMAQTVEDKYIPSSENLEARKWFQDAKFGIFIHWGVYSLMAGAGEKDVAEWVMEEKRNPH